MKHTENTHKQIGPIEFSPFQIGGLATSNLNLKAAPSRNVSDQIIDPELGLISESERDEIFRMIAEANALRRCGGMS